VNLPVVPLPLFRRIATATCVAYALLVVTGGAVRLTDSGLGCPDWPTCSADHITAALAGHRGVEFGNRLVTVAVTVLSIAVFLAAFRIVPRRRDLRLLAGGLIVGLVAQIVLGGLVVLFKLNPYLVSLHFLLTLIVLADALYLRYRTIHGDGFRRPLLGRDLEICSCLAVGAIGILIAAGTIVTGSGPHAGGSGAKRIHLAFRDAAELHSTIALFTIGLVLALLFGLHQVRAAASVQRRARLLLEVLAIQGTLGYTQYALHDNALVVEFHLAGATAVWCAAVAFALSLREPVRTEEERDPNARREPVEVGRL
jgi:cytochrome c oxidase assembly protein subunit 15